MKKFQRTRTLDEVKAFCAERDWKIDTTEYDKLQGSDYVKIYWQVGRLRGDVLLSTFNGRFFGETAGRHFDSSSSAHDHKPWFRALLEMAYV